MLGFDFGRSIIRWLGGKVEETENREDIVKLRDIFNLYKESETFKNLTRDAKRATNEFKDFVKLIAENPFYEKFYKKEIQNPTHLRDVLIYHKQVAEEDDIEIEQTIRQVLT